MSDIITLRAFQDNLIYLWVFDQNKAVVVDPGDADVVIHALEKHALHLEAVLATHHHNDHTGGIPELKKRTGARIIGPDLARIPLIDQLVQDGQVLQFGSRHVQVMGTPGHTLTSVCYYVPGSDGPGKLWTGDTLFQGSCGRLFEGDAETMWASLQRLAGLPPETVVYFGHDYAVENYAFALTIDPTNHDIQEAAARARQGFQPSTIGQERQTNIFLISDCRRIRRTLNMQDAPAAQVFAVLRRQKDMF